MGWAILGAFLLLAYFGIGALLFVGSTADDRAVAEYERARAAFDRLFE